MSSNQFMTGVLKHFFAYAAKLHRFTLSVFLPTLIVVVFYLWQSPSPDGPLAWLYFLTIPAYYFFLFMLAMLVLVIASSFRWLQWLPPLVASLWLVMLCVDALVFSLYKFHINLFLLKMFFVDFKGIGIPIYLGVVLLGFVAGVLGLTAVVWRKTQALGLVSRKTSVVISLMGLVLFGVNQTIHIVGVAKNMGSVTRFSPFMPFFAPIQDPKGAVWLDAHLPWLAANLNTQPQENGIQKSSLINYPKQPVQCHADTPKDMVWVVLESWQADTLDKQTMPHTFALAQSAWNFRQHVSGGNSTVPGLFSLLYGLHPTYYDAFRGDPKAHPSYFTDTLASLGYESRVFTSGTLETFSMRPLFFSKVKDEHFHHFQGQATETEDAHLLEAWKKSRTESQASPRFDFIFFNSSHYPYSYPASFLKHQPVSENKAAYILNRDMDPLPLKNHYKNSLSYLDSLLLEVTQHLKKTNRWNDTWLVVVGDHGEEFNENRLRYWGHVSNYSKWQTQTPLIVKPAGAYQAQEIQKTSTHQDLVPTMMTRVLGCPASQISDYSNGKLLDQLPDQRSTVIGSYVSTAYWVNQAVQDKLLAHLRYDWNDMNQSKPEIPSAYVFELMKEESHFFKP